MAVWCLVALLLSSLLRAAPRSLRRIEEWDLDSGNSSSPNPGKRGPKGITVTTHVSFDDVSHHGEGSKGPSGGSVVDEGGKEDTGWQTEDIRKLVKPSVVNIHVSTQLPVYGDSPGNSVATGFVVDTELGIIATNKHVTGRSRSSFQVVFYDGMIMDANLLYYDTRNDFGFLSVGTKINNSRALKFAEKSLQVGDPVLMIGNNEEQDYTMKFGRVSHLARSMTGHVYIQTSFDRTGGSSGSPVLNADYEVVGLHCAGSQTTSYELDIRYLKPALKSLRNGHSYMNSRFDAPISLIPLGDAIRYYRVPDSCVSKEGRKDTGGAPQVMLVGSSSSEFPVQPGDVICKVQGRFIHEDMLRLSQAVERKIQGHIKLTVARVGELKDVSVPIQRDPSRIRRFAVFDTAVFHDITQEMQKEYRLDVPGVFLSYAPTTSMFAGIGYTSQVRPNTKMVLIHSIGGRPTGNLDQFLEVASQLQEEHTFAVFTDLLSMNMRPSPVELDVHIASELTPIKLWEYESSWVEKSTDHVIPAVSKAEKKETTLVKAITLAPLRNSMQPPKTARKQTEEHTTHKFSRKRKPRKK